MGQILGKNAAQTTTSAYVSALKQELPPGRRFIVHLVELNVNAVKYKILGSLDDVTYETIQAETDLAKNASDWKTIDNPWVFIDVQIVDAVAETHGSIKVVVAGG